MKRLIPIFLFTLILVDANAHPIPGLKGVTKAIRQLQAAARSLEKYKASLAEAGHYNCCVKAPEGSKTPGCNLCAIKNGSCSCGANLAAGKGVCGECKGDWIFGKGALKTDTKPEDIPVLSSDHQAMAGVIQDKNDPNLKEYQSLVLYGKKTMVGEKRFNCCIGEGGCHECALEGSCGCGVNLAADMNKKAGEKKAGICGQCYDGQVAGIGRIAGVQMDQMKMMPPMDMDHMDSAMGREGSGTSWLPDSSPMYMKSLPKLGGFDVDLMGSVQAGYVDAGGRRGDSQLFANSMVMLMGHREIGKGALGFHLMGSLDPLTNGKSGVPNLFQTGETNDGKPLRDRQHPHDLIAEIAATYEAPIAKDAKASIYLAPVGEPALGGTMFMMRPSGMEDPEAPISHHWFDSTHISFGVATAGLTFGDKWKIEGSAFNGKEPDENRYDIDPIRLDSASGRISYNPTHDWSFSLAYGFIKDPEALEPGISQHRLTASAAYNRAYGNGDNLAVALLYGRNMKSAPGVDPSNAFALEGTFTTKRQSYFARLERVEKDELVDVPQGVYTINKITFGTVYDFVKGGDFDWGIGGYLGLYSFPSALNDFYGKSPVTAGIFLRIRPAKMKM